MLCRARIRPQGLMSVLNLATHQVLVRRAVTFHPALNNQGPSTKQTSSRRAEETHKPVKAGDVDVELFPQDEKAGNRISKRWSRSHETCRQYRELFASLPITTLRAQGKGRPWLGARGVRNVKAHQPCRTTTLALCGVMGQSGMEEQPAAVEVDRVWNVLALPVLAISEGQASELPPEPRSIAKAKNYLELRIGRRR